MFVLDYTFHVDNPLRGVIRALICNVAHGMCAKAGVVAVTPLRGIVHSCSCFFVSLIFRLPIVVVARGRNDSFWDTCQRMGNCWKRFHSGTTSVT